MVLPALASGYFSGASDNEDDFNPDADNVVKEVTEKRKNRRGQRARQKIWEAKYGKNAAHVKKEGERKYHEAKQRQEDFEAREARRERENALKAIAIDENPALKKLEEKKVKNATHPSWEAKKKLKEMQKTASFSGKKITFD
ncbi:Bud-site selection protein [Nadsonia fulvescens var. elongata DSM 6958]|uniref:Bud-site selection protein n=1 Tax=Nadsonia fulvescens var. elongata DSM 6958 TaxID=857566 RepID=A0A1E3PQV7_9ASCO|nr:Bud-site selection protein [Nadsonia fulvescens var. elongata DSM 6958]